MRSSVNKFILAIILLSWVSLGGWDVEAATLTYFRYHIVHRGDTLYDISREYGVPIGEIKKKNNLGTDRIYPGQKLIIPIKIKGVYHQVEKGEYLWRICKTYQVNIQEVIRLNHLSNPDDIKEGQRIFIPGATEVIDVEVPEEIILGRKSPPPTTEQNKITERELVKAKGSLIWPIKEEVTRYTKTNSGIDIPVLGGTTIIASAEGKVFFSRWHSKVRGYIIIIEHQELGLFTLYMHRSLFDLTEEGTWVKKGDPIAKIGGTGTKEQVMLHFEVRTTEDGKPLDPLDYLP